MADDAWSTIENHQEGSLFASIPHLLRHAIDPFSLSPFFHPIHGTHAQRRRWPSD